jgi:hypothetical protein
MPNNVRHDSDDICARFKHIRHALHGETAYRDEWDAPY